MAYNTVVLVNAYSELRAMRVILRFQRGPVY